MLIPLFPIDIVKSRSQSAEGKLTMQSTVKVVYKSGGVKAFLSDLGPALAKAILVNVAGTLG